MSGELPAPEAREDSVLGEKEAGNESPEEGTPGSSSPPPSVSEQIHKDILAAEFLVGLFWSATNSFRHDSILRPFPSMFIEGGGVGGEGVEGAGEDTEPQGGREGDKNKDIEGLVRT